MEHPTNLMMITCVLFLKGNVPIERIKDVYRSRLLQFRRFRQRVVGSSLPFGTPHWEDDPYFDLDAHFHHIALPDPGSRAQLVELLSDLSSSALDFNRPLWQAHVVDNLEGGGTVLVMRVHHCIGDGAALMTVASQIMDSEPEALAEPGAVPERRRRSRLATVVGGASSVVSGTRSVLGSIWHEGAESLAHPGHLLDLGQSATNFAAANASMLGRAIARPSEQVSPIHGRLGIAKRVAWTRPVSLEETKRIGKTLGGTVNDVLTSAMTGALRSYLIGRGADTSGMTVHAVVPINFRPLERGVELGNEFGLVFLGLPIWIDDPLQRLLEVRRKMDALKDSNEALFYYGLLNFVGVSPKTLEDNLVSFFGSKATLVLTNVVGPKTPVYFAGAQVENMIFWVPQSGRLGMGISIFSYNAHVTMGVITDAGLTPDPEGITVAFEREFALLQRIASERAMVAHAGLERRPVCIATTANGSRCRNAARPASACCHVHSRSVAVLHAN